MGGRRTRRLSREEIALWSEVAKTARPIRPPAPDRQEAEPPPSAPPRDRPAQGQPASLPRPHSRPQPGASRPQAQIHLAPDPVAPLGPATPGLDRRTAERLRKGRTEPQARIDLHGHTLDRAHRECTAFIRREQARGARCVLVITGKGRRREDDWGVSAGGVLRESVPRWLRLPPLSALVVGVYPAHQKHGGGGAFYVYLRKPR